MVYGGGAAAKSGADRHGRGHGGARAKSRVGVYLYLYIRRAKGANVWYWQGFPKVPNMQIAYNQWDKKKVPFGIEKSARKICRIRKSRYLCNRIWEGNTQSLQNNGFWKSFEKSFQIIWRFEKLDLSLHPLSPQNESSVLKKKVWKILQKDLVVSKKGFTFAPLSAPKMSGQNERPKGRPEQTKQFL